MHNPVNPFKKALRERRAQIGFWLGLADNYSTEICASAGFDWLLVDSEHSPADQRTLLAQAQAIAGYPATHAVARVPMGHGDAGTAYIKRVLDLGFQSILVPMVDTAEQARAIVQATRYAPAGVRGMGTARAARWGRIPAYATEANDEICVLVQVETREALEQIEAIAAVDGVDGLFIGPADLSASLGYPGKSTIPQVQSVILDSIRRIVATGKAAGILTLDETLAQRQLDAGATFVAVGIDSGILARATSALVAKFKA